MKRVGDLDLVRQSVEETSELKQSKQTEGSPPPTSTFDSGSIDRNANMFKAFVGSIERRTELGSGAAEGESVFARPVKPSAQDIATRGVSAMRIFRAKQKIYDDFKKNGTFTMPTDLKSAEKDRVTQYLKDNTFHFLGSALHNGHFEAAKALIDAGGFNEVSSRLMDMLQHSKLTPEQKNDLLGNLLRKCTDGAYKSSELDLGQRVTDASKIVSTMIDRGQKAKAQEIIKKLPTNTLVGKQFKSVLAAQVGDEETFNDLYNGMNSIQKAELMDMRTASGENIVHLATTGGNANIIGTVADQMVAHHAAKGKIVNPFRMNASPKGARLLNRLRGMRFDNNAIDRMSPETAAALDRKYAAENVPPDKNPDLNAPGTFSSAVSHSKIMQTRASLAKIAAFGLVGKLMGDAAADHLAKTFQTMGTALGVAAPNAVMYAPALLFSLIQSHVLQPAAAKRLAKNLGVDRKLTGYMEDVATRANLANPLKEKVAAKVAKDKKFLATTGKHSKAVKAWLADTTGDKATPTLGISTIHALEAMPTTGDSKQFQGKLTQLLESAPPEKNRPEDGNKLVEHLLEVAGQKDPAATAKAISTRIKSLTASSDARPPDNKPDNKPLEGQLRSFMVAATRMGDVPLMKEIEDVWKKEISSTDSGGLFLDTFVRRDNRNVLGEGTGIGRGSTLAHIALAGEHLDGAVYLRQKMNDAIASRQKAAGKDGKATHTLPRFAGRKQVKLTNDAFRMLDAGGTPASRHLNTDFATELDRATGVDPADKNSLTNVAHAEENLRVRMHGNEVATAGLAKTLANLAGMGLVGKAAIAAGAIAGGLSGPAAPIVGPLAGTLTYFVLGTGLAALGAAAGYVGGKMRAKSVDKTLGRIPEDEIPKGYNREVLATQVAKAANEQVTALYRHALQQHALQQHELQQEGSLSHEEQTKLDEILNTRVTNANELNKKVSAFTEALPEKIRTTFVQNLEDQINKLSATAGAFSIPNGAVAI